MKNIWLTAASLLIFFSCSDLTSGDSTSSDYLLLQEAPAMAPRDIARMFAALPMEQQHFEEVHGAVCVSSGEGYDEEYMLRTVFENPGGGTGGTKASSVGQRPLRDLITEYLTEMVSPLSKSSGSLDDAILSLSESGLQVYWPYSEDWDGETAPVITFDPGNGAESGYGYILGSTDSIVVDEKMAQERPVWVINSNSDCGFTPAFVPHSREGDGPAPTSVNRNLMLKRFKMLRNYDSWFGGASEFWIRCGSVEGFTASTEAELKLYYPSVTEFYVVVKRRDKGKDIELNSIILTDFTNQLDKLAFMITEDDGGTVSSWKCSATVKIKSKSYGFDISLPFNEHDDIVWRGQLSASFFQSGDEVTGRFGDVCATFALE